MLRSGKMGKHGDSLVVRGVRYNAEVFASAAIWKAHVVIPVDRVPTITMDAINSDCFNWLSHSLVLCKIAL